MLLDYIAQGGILMGLLVTILFVCLSLIIYASLVLAVEVIGVLRFRRRRKALDRTLDPDRIVFLATGVKSLPARFLLRFRDELDIRQSPLTPTDRQAVATELENELVGGATWPLDVLHFLAEYASKVGLFGTILGLCIHFLAFGTDGDSALASQAMAIALYTTLGALVIALIAEPSAFLLERVEDWIRRDVNEWFRHVERGLQRQGSSAVKPAADHVTESVPPRKKTHIVWKSLPGLTVSPSEESGS